MKVLCNWRYYAIYALFTVGLLAVARAFGEPAEPMSNAEWLWQFAMSLSVGSVCFYALARLTKRWGREGKIPEFTNQEIE